MIHLLFNENIVFYILINLKIVGIFLTYSNYNFYYFYKYDFNKKYTFGRFFEIIPYCITGYIFAYLNIVHILSKHRKTSINILLPILILIIKYLSIFSLVNNKKLNGSIIIYVLSYNISLFGKFKFINTKLINLFQ